MDPGENFTGGPVLTIAAVLRTAKFPRSLALQDPIPSRFCNCKAEMPLE